MTMALPAPLAVLFENIEKHQEHYKTVLKEAVAIRSVSADPELRDECHRMVEWTAEKLKKLGVACEFKDIGEQNVEGKTIKLPKVLVGHLGNDPKKKTVCIYGHLDVQPANREDGWNSDPFEMVEVNGKMYGRGTSDDKGPVLCWIHAIESYQQTNIEIPVNIKFVLEAMEESGSVGLDELVRGDLGPSGFFNDVDYICISDSIWLSTKKPALQYGHKGLCYFFVEVECASQDLHSGVMGGSVHEGMADLVYLLDTLVDKDCNILVDNLYKEVAPLFPGEKELYDPIDFDPEIYRKTFGAKALPHKGDKTKLLMNRWRYPTLSIHGIQDAFYQPGTKTVIPGKVTGKFSIRIVPNQEPKQIEKYVVEYLNKKWAERGSPNYMKAYMLNGSKPWVTDPKNDNFSAAAKATKYVYEVEPDYCREGGTIPVTLTFEEVSGKSILLLPVGASDDMAHSQNEKLNVSNYVKGTQLLGAYLYEIGQLK